ncbi:MAG TPA: killer suppression protein [Armatimonadota bacterium]|nr:killer suppression protein [Armatimonadota bacterium]
MRAKIVGRRLDQMRLSRSLKAFSLVHPRCHPLIGNRAGQWSADLDGPYRLIFEIAVDPVPMDDYGSIDLDKVQKVRIIDVADTH